MSKNILILASKNGWLGKYLRENGFAVEDVWKNDHFSKRKYFILKLLVHFLLLHF